MDILVFEGIARLLNCHHLEELTSFARITTDKLNFYRWQQIHSYIALSYGRLNTVSIENESIAEHYVKLERDGDVAVRAIAKTVVTVRLRIQPIVNVHCGQCHYVGLHVFYGRF